VRYVGSVFEKFVWDTLGTDEFDVILMLRFDFNKCFFTKYFLSVFPYFFGINIEIEQKDTKNLF
jgi:hypothetical protein